MRKQRQRGNLKCWLAQPVKQPTLDLEVVNLSPITGVKIKKGRKEGRKIKGGRKGGKGKKEKKN